MLSLQEISDRLEIQAVIAGYSYAVDRHEWDRFDHIFTPDADLDYEEISGRRGDRAYLKAWLSTAMPRHQRPYYHLTATPLIEVDGDTATCSCICFNPMPLGSDGARLFGHWYHDRLVRTPEGWRISHRRLEPCFMYTLPPTAGSPTAEPNPVERNAPLDPAG